MSRRLVALLLCFAPLLFIGCADKQIVYVTVEVPVDQTGPTPPGFQDLSGEDQNTIDEPLAPTLPPQTQVKNRVLVHGIRYTSNTSDDKYVEDSQITKFAALAFTRGLRVSACPSPRDFLRELESPDVSGAVLLGMDNADVIAALHAFLGDGGKAIVIYNAASVEHNSLIQDLFDVSIVQEEVMRVDDSVILPPSTLPFTLRDYQVGMVRDGWDYMITSYLASTADMAPGYLASQDSGKERLVILWNDDLVFMPGVHSYLDKPADNQRHMRSWSPFFFDDQFDNFENEGAANALLDLISSQ